MQGDAFYDGLPDVPAEVRRAEPGESIEPVTIVVTRQCAYKKKPCGLCGKPQSNPVHKKSGGSCRFKRQNGCATCGAAKNDPTHLGAPESFNVFASGSWEAYQAAKQRWHRALEPLLLASGLPKGLARVLVEAECSFGDERDRDQGNHRVVPEKALGDVLQQLGFIANDKWGAYEFGNLARREEPGVNRTVFTLFAFAPEPPEPEPQGSLLG